MSLNQIEVQRMRLKRLRILQTLDLVRPETCGDLLIVQSLKDDTDLALTITDVQRALDYLSGCGLVDAKKQGNNWLAKITVKGVDYLHGLGEDLAGVARPQEF